MPTLVARPLLMRSLSDDWSVYGTSTFTAGNPAVSVQHRRPGVYGRSTDASSGTPAKIRFNAGATIDPDDQLTWVLARHDGTVGTLKARLRYASDSAFSSVTYDSGSGGQTVDQPYEDRLFAHYAFAAATGAASQYAEVTLWATSATYVDIARIMIGEPWQFGTQLGEQEPSPGDDARLVAGTRGQQYEVDGVSYFGAAGEMLIGGEADYRTFKALVHRLGKSRPLLYSNDPTESTYAQESWFTGRFTELPRYRIVQPGLRGATFAVEEYH